MKKINEIKEVLNAQRTDYELNTGSIIQKLRKERGVSQLHLALAIGSSAAHMSKLETNQKIPSLQTIVKIAHALDIEPIEFFNELFKK